MNELIEQIFDGFTVDGRPVPVEFLRYKGKANAYIVYSQVNADQTLAADDDIVNYMDYYDFSIYSKGNYLNIAEAVKQRLRDNGFVWQPQLSSADMYEDDTGYYHKVLNFAIERSI